MIEAWQTLANLQGSSRESSFHQCILHQTKMIRPLYPQPHLVTKCGMPQEGHHFGERLCSAAEADPEGAGSRLLTGLPTAGPQVHPWKGIWWCICLPQRPPRQCSCKLSGFAWGWVNRQQQELVVCLRPHGVSVFLCLHNVSFHLSS